MNDNQGNSINLEAARDMEAKVQAHDHNQTKTQVIVFKLGEEEYAIKIDQIKEVVLTPAITKMPQTNHYIKGVANIRGNIIAILDLEEKFGIVDQHDSSTGQYTLVVESEELKAGILVREVPNTLTVNESLIDESLNNGVEAGGDTGFIKGIIKLEHKLVFLMDIFKVVTEQDINVNAGLKYQKQQMVQADGK